MLPRLPRFARFPGLPRGYPDVGRILSLVAMALGTATAGCASSSKPATPLVATTFQPVVHQFVGTPATGPLPTLPPSLAEPASPGAGDAWDVRFEVFAFESGEFAESLEPLPAQARLIIAWRGDSPVAAVGRQTGGTRVGFGSASGEVRAKLTGGGFGRTSSLGAERVALPDGTTATITLSNMPDPTRPGAPTAMHPGGILIGASRVAGAGEAVEFYLALTETLDLDGVPVEQRELAVLRPLRVDPTTGRSSTVFVVPVVSAQSSARAIVAIVDIAQAESSPEHDAAFATARERLTRSAADARARLAASQPRPGVPSDWPALHAALVALQSNTQPAARRSALAFLADRTAAEWCRDVALVADDTDLARLAEMVIRSIPADGSPIAGDALRWTLDRAAIEVVCVPPAPPPPTAPPPDTRGANSSESPPAPAAPPPQPQVARELVAVLLQHAGEAGRTPSTVMDLAKRSSDSAAFAEKLLAENLIALEDASPASRVRAFDWLAARGRAPDGFDPLGAPRDRRAALERMTDASSKPPAGGPSAPPPPIAPAAPTTQTTNSAEVSQ